MKESDFKLAESKIAIVGLGLMGGSLALALKGKCAALFGIDPDHSALELALSQNIVDRADSDPSKLLPEANLVILAAPLPAILDWLKELPRFIRKPCVVLDLGSSKAAVASAMEALPTNFDPIGGHPICGKEKLSLANAERTLYYAAPFLLTPLERTSSRALSAAHQIIEAVGAKAKILDAEEHDRILAATSHLPFLLSSALALSTPPEVASFVGSGFKSTSRLAGTPSSMMLGVLQSNRENLLEAIDRFQAGLDSLEAAIQDNNEGRLNELLDSACSQYYSLISS